MPRVLYIEDNADNRLLVRRILMASDIEVDEIDNAITGIQMAQDNPPDLILMDISMPGMDGLSATERLRSMPQLDHVPIVALTANVREGDRQMTIEAGCDGYIGKPIDVDKFPDQVLHYMRSRRRL
ncbi:MAG: response regulator [Phototrophicaceae bacterium]|jgi:CheY-like chemotaxis protein